MKTCRVYKLEMYLENVPEFDTHYLEHFYSFKGTGIIDIGGSPQIKEFEGCGKEIYTPIQEFTTNTLPHHLKGHLVDCVDDYIEREYLVIDKHLEKLLATKYLEDIRGVETLLDLEMDRNISLEKDLSDFKSMSFWKRVKFLFKGRNL